MTDPEKKIIVDEDWKSQVERERAAAEAAQEEPANAPQDFGILPPASFEVLVSSMAAQTMAALGHIADPTTGKPEVRFDYAQLQIDLLAMLEEKTHGNLNEVEGKLLEETLHQLRMIFVATQQQSGETGG